MLNLAASNPHLIDSPVSYVQNTNHIPQESACPPLERWIAIKIPQILQPNL